MSCFPCFQSKKSRAQDDDVPVAKTKDVISPPPHVHIDKQTSSAAATNNAEGGENGNSTARTFNFRELAAATKNFRQECLMGEGGFGRVFKGTLKPSGQIVVVRQLDRSGTLGSKEFMVEVMMLSLLRHPNLVNMIGYCADGDQRILVYEYMPSGSLESHLFANEKPLDWSARMKIATGIAAGLEYLHEKANPPIIYCDLKSSNILLDEMNHPRLSEYGLAKLVQSGNKMHISPRVMAVYGYSAPEYERQGELTLKSDVYSFGVVLLELITGRRALDSTRPTEEQNLVSWAQPFFRDPKKFPDLADPLLKGAFPATSLNQAVGVAAMCLQEEPSVRPLMADVVAALSFLAISPPEAPVPARLEPLLSGKVETSPSQRKKEVNPVQKYQDTDEQFDDDDGEGEEDYENSEPEYGYSSEDPEDDDRQVIASQDQNKSGSNLKESEKSGLSFKSKSKVESKGMQSVSGPGSYHSSSPEIGLPEQNDIASGSKQDVMRENNVEYSTDNLGSSSQKQSNDRRVISKKSRRKSKKDVNSKSSNRNGSSKSSGWDSRETSNVKSKYKDDSPE